MEIWLFCGFALAIIKVWFVPKLNYCLETEKDVTCKQRGWIQDVLLCSWNRTGKVGKWSGIEHAFGIEWGWICMCLQYGNCIGFLSFFTYIFQYPWTIAKKCMKAFGLSQVQAKFYILQWNCQEYVMNSIWKADFQCWKHDWNIEGVSVMKHLIHLL